MISKNLDTMLSKLEQSPTEERRVAAKGLRLRITRWAEDGACYRCSHAVFGCHGVGPISAKPSDNGNPARLAQPFEWRIFLGACGAYIPVSDVTHEDGTPILRYFCTAESADEIGAGLPADDALAVALRGQRVAQADQPRQRGQREGE